ncbi:MAG: class I SAM-dependent methyltransferase [Gammaproteobacteria bacterium]|nr:class I SAM-dependent methyltransferase [Gammaproteobacteria bacterium]
MPYTIEEVRQAVIEAGSDDTEMFGFPEKSDGLHLQQNPDEYAEFVCFMANEVAPAELALDIGIAAGGQTKFLRDYYPVAKTIVVDIGEHPKFHHWQRIKPTVKTEIVLELIEDSHTKSVREALKPYAGQVDFAFIDGDHSYKGLKQDIDLAKTVARKDALFVLHDTLAVPDCKRVFDELGRDEDFQLVRNFDKRFGISVWRYLAVRGPKVPWWSRLFGG